MKKGDESVVEQMAMHSPPLIMLGIERMCVWVWVFFKQATTKQTPPQTTTAAATIKGVGIQKI